MANGADGSRAFRKPGGSWRSAGWVVEIGRGFVELGRGFVELGRGVGFVSAVGLSARRVRQRGGFVSAVGLSARWVCQRGGFVSAASVRQRRVGFVGAGAPRHSSSLSRR